MSEFLRLIWDVCCLRRGPQDLPYAPLLLGLLCVALVALQVALGMLLNPTQSAFASAVFELAFDLGVLFLLLSVRDLRNRYVQTALALFGCALLFQLLILPLLVMLSGAALPQDGGDPHLTPQQGLAVLLGYGLLLWKLLVDAHILRNALNVRFALGVLIAVLWAVIEIALNNAAGGSPAPTA